MEAPETKRNSVFIAASIDGYIADINGGIDWLNAIPNPDNIDMGYHEFISRIDAIVMGRKTFETVCHFDIDWPYQKPVFVLSNSLTVIPEKYRKKAWLVKGELNKVLDSIYAQGYYKLYIDGGLTIQNFLREDLIDEMIITIIPILLGDGISLFAGLKKRVDFECVESLVFLEKIVQNHFVRKR
jgi:dihydrofolate reductase